MFNRTLQPAGESCSIGAVMLDLEPHEKEGFMYILGVPLLIAVILGIAFLTHVVLKP